MATITIIKPIDECNHTCEKRVDTTDIEDTESTNFDDNSICLSTKYYRRNKLSRDKIHKCPHCDYETAGPKQTLINHINAKHKAEKDKPFYCACCNKGFAQAANYEKHMKNIHGETVKVTKTREQRKPYMYVIIIDKYLPSSKNTIARVKYYKTHLHIKAEDLGKISYKEGKVLSQKDIHYDRKTGYIGFTAYTKVDYEEYVNNLVEDSEQQEPRKKNKNNNGYGNSNKTKKRRVKKLILKTN